MDKHPSLTLSDQKAFPWWGKSGQRDAADHSALPAHLLSVAANFLILVKTPSIGNALCNAWGVRSIDPLLPWLLLSAMLHDLGKTDVHFQDKNEKVVDWIIDHGGMAKHAAKATEGFDHSVFGGLNMVDVTLDLLSDISPEIVGVIGKGATTRNKLINTRKVMMGLLYASFAHHGFHPGVFTKESEIGIFDPDKWGGEIDLLTGMLSHLMDVVVSTCGEFQSLPEPKLPAAVSQIVAGWTTLADWLGSNEDQYPFINCVDFQIKYSQSQDWIELFKSYLVIAQGKIDSLSITKAPDTTQFQSAVMGNFALRPIQEASLATAQRFAIRGQCGALILIEAPMGVGKTEAALLAALPFLDSGQSDAISFGLPSQSSANMIYKRTTAIAQQVFGINEGALGHSGSKFAVKRMRSLTGEDELMESVAHLDEWVTDNNKKVFLSPLSSVTVDQMQLGAMHSKHGFLRFAAISRGVVIIDEIHAYDAYMSSIIDVLLNLLGASGTPVILLSATLPVQVRRNFLKAYAHGAKWVIPDLDFSTNSYPIITGMVKHESSLDNLSNNQSKAEVTFEEVPWTDPIKHVQCKMISDLDWAQTALDTANRGLCVAVLTNTVGSAQDRYDVLREIAPDADITLLHSRYRLEDRMDIQTNIENFCGKSSSQEQRKGKIIVATQVLEQSIDIDLDLMISEPAPIDLLLQRMGRLFRHIRSYRLFQPLFMVIDPGELENEIASWFKWTKAVYKQANKVEISLKIFRELTSSGAGEIRLPTDIPKLIGLVYTDGDLTFMEEKAHSSGEAAALDVKCKLHTMGHGGVSSKTREGEEGNRILFIIEDESGDRFIPAKNGAIPLPSVFDVHDEKKVNQMFLEISQPWLVSVGSHTEECRAIAKLKDENYRDIPYLELDWRTGTRVEKYPPPFFMVVIKNKNVKIINGEVEFKITSCVYYSSKRGLYHAN